MIDLDANATTPLLPEVLEAMLPWLQGQHANPSGTYRTAKLARKAIEQARAQVAELIGAEEEEIVFTGSGTESVNTALASLDHLARPGVALVSRIEHSAVLRFVENRARAFDTIPVHPNGRLDLDALRSLIPSAGYVSVMMANNETGVIQPLAEVIQLAKENGLPIHTDAIQAAGKIPLDVRKDGVDLLSISAHKFHGPKGIGALFIRKGLDFHPFLYGGGQEAGRRSGTENVAAIVAMGEAARLAKVSLENGDFEKLKDLRDQFENKILDSLSGCSQNGDTTQRLANTSHLSFEGCDASGLLILLDEAGIACSAGSACMSGKSKPSHVQLAMGLSEKQAKSSLRFSFSKFTTESEIAKAAEKIILAVEKLRRVQAHGVGPVLIYPGGLK